MAGLDFGISEILTILGSILGSVVALVTGVWRVMEYLNKRLERVHERISETKEGLEQKVEFVRGQYDNLSSRVVLELSAEFRKEMKDTSEKIRGEVGDLRKEIRAE